MADEVITRDENGDLAMRTVSATEVDGGSQYDDLYARTTDGKRALCVVGGGSGGNYLALSGGTINGDLSVDGTLTITGTPIGSTSQSYTLKVLSLTDGISLSASGGKGIRFYYSYAQPDKTAFYPSDDKIGLGRPGSKWRALYCKTINNGMDIFVPATAGTMVVATPPDSAGTYVLKATVTDDGTITTEWVAE